MCAIIHLQRWQLFYNKKDNNNVRLLNIKSVEMKRYVTSCMTATMKSSMLTLKVLITACNVFARHSQENIWQELSRLAHLTLHSHRDIILFIGNTEYINVDKIQLCTEALGGFKNEFQIRRGWEFFWCWGASFWLARTFPVLCYHAGRCSQTGDAWRLRLSLCHPWMSPGVVVPE